VRASSRVRAADARYVLLGGGPFGRGGGGATAWVQATCAAVPPAAFGGAAQPFGGSRGFRPGEGADQLYDCGASQGTAG
jgi:hypothetical protein